MTAGPSKPRASCQYLYINRKEKIVAVVWSAWPKPEMDDREEETYAFLGAAVKALR